MIKEVRSLVESHSREVSAVVDNFSEYVRGEVELAIDELSSYLTSLTPTKRSKVVDPARLLAAANVFTMALRRSNYFPAIQALASDFVEQTDWAYSIYEEAQDRLQLPNIPLNTLDRSTIEKQAVEGEFALEDVSTRVQASFRRYLGRSLGEVVDVPRVAQGVIGIARGVSKVGPIARDGIMSWFRTFVGSMYRKLESLGYRLTYEYVGVSGEDSRDFCLRTLAHGPRTLEEVDVLDNGQAQGALTNGGGYNCPHFWVIAGRV